MKPQTKKRRLSGIVVSNKMDKTIVVRVDRTVEHPKYIKRYTMSSRFKVHVEGDKPEVGTEVTIEETRPMSKDKRWILVK